MSRPTSPDPTATVRQRFLRFYRHRGIALAAFMVVVCAAIPFILALPALYRSSATVLIERATFGVATDVPVAETEGRLQAIKQEAFSRQRLLGLADRFDLYPALRLRVPEEVLLARLQDDIGIDVKSTQQTSSAVAFVVSYTGRNPDTAAAVANTLASYYVERNDSFRTLQTSQTTKHIEEQIAEVKKRLDTQAGRMTSAARSGGVMPQQVLANISSLGLLNTQLQQNGDEQLKLSERRMNLQKEIADLGLRGPDALGDPTGALLATKQRELAGLIAAGATDQYPDVRLLRKEIADLETRTKAGRGGGPASAQRATLQASLTETETRLATLRQEKQSILEGIRQQQGRVASATVREPEVRQINDDYQSARDSYEMLLKQLEQARLNERAAAGQTGESFRVIDPAVAPGGAVGPNRLRLLLVALVVAIGFGLGAAFLADRMDTSFGSVDELRSFTRVPVLASIPQISTRRDSRSKWLRVAATMTASVVVLVAVAAASAQIGAGNEMIARLLLRVG